VIQRLIARFGGTPALILKLLFLGLVNAMTVWALPGLISSKSWAMLAVLVIATLALDFILLTKRLIPAKYVIIGAIFLTVFQLIPIGYNVSIAFTNYSTGNIGTKEDAVTAIIRDSAKETDTSTSYDMLPARNAAGDLVLILTPQVVSGDTPGTSGDAGATGPDTSASSDPNTTEFGGGGDASTPASEDPNTTEFGGGGDASTPASEDPNTTEFGGTDSASPSASADLTSGTNDLNVPTDTEPSNLPPTYVGTNDGLDEVPVSDVQRDEFGTVTGVTDYAVVPDDELSTLDTELNSMTVPGPDGGIIKPQGYTTAVELVPTLTYDPVANTFTSLETGVVYVDNGSGNFANPANPEDDLVPGWREYVGFKNFTNVFTDAQIRDPFINVFIWTFIFAILSVLLSFVLGLSLAIVLNKERMRGQRVYRALLVLPYAVPAFLSILVWAGILNDDFGALNNVTGWHVPWLFDPFWAKVSVIMVNLWLGFPYMFLVSTGALQAIPSELQEAARVDGARTFQIWRRVNMPLLLIALAPLLIASFAFNFNNFNVIYLLTAGGPAMDNSEVAGATDILISYTYKIAFSAGEGNDYGLASAISIYIFLIVGTISAIMFARSRALREERP
jgi:arabinogalactan oligomer/maltooligosaccharide transport system permease protein